MFTELKLTAKVPQPVGFFGQAVSIGGDYAIVGAGQSSSLNLGAAYIFARNGSTWAEQAKLTNRDGAPFDAFGTSVGIDKDYAAVGASGAGTTGKVYIYHRNGSKWSELTQVVPSGGAAGSFFGTSISLDGNTLIVGAWDAAFIFRRTGSNWIEQAKLTDNATTQTLFGLSVSVEADYAIIGAPYASVGGKFGAGLAYIFRRSGAIWVQQAILSATDAAESYYFGQSVSISGNFAIVGAPGAKSGGIADSGAAYIFERNGPAWQQVSKVEPTQPHQVKSFGWSVSMITTTRFENYAIVGDRSDFDAGPISGAAYLFKRTGATWSRIEPKITAGDAALGDEFGWSVSISGDSILIGAPEHTDTEPHQGAAYVYTDFLDLDVSGIDVDKWQIYAIILFGIMGGGGGKIFLPGSGPVPVDPEPFRVWMNLSPSKRDVYIGLMLRDIANLIDDEEGKQQVKKVGTSLRRKAAQKLNKLKARK